MDDQVISILKVWNRFFLYDPTNEIQLTRKYFKSDYIMPIEPYLYNSAFSLIGKRRKRFLYGGLEEQKAWIIGLGWEKSVDIEKLLSIQIQNAEKTGIREIYYSNFTPDYFLPGVDKDKYPELYDLLTDEGFRVIDEVMSMEANLGQMKYFEENFEGISYLKKDEKGDLLKFISSNFSPDWYYRAKVVVGYGTPEQIVVARDGDKIIGYGMYSSGEGVTWYNPGERFGPFGVQNDYRSKGIGSRIIKMLINSMKENGIKCAYFLWTDEKASHIYLRHGFTVSRKFEIMKYSVF